MQLACREEHRVVWATDLGYCLQECFYASHFQISLEIAEPLCNLRKYCLFGFLVTLRLPLGRAGWEFSLVPPDQGSSGGNMSMTVVSAWFPSHKATGAP